MKGIFVALTVAAVCACGGSGGGSNTTAPKNPPPGNTTTPSGGVSVTNDAFSPGTKTVAVGTTVKWAWNTCSSDPYYGTGQTCTSHSVTFDDGTTSPTQDQGTFERTFSAAGTYNYHCVIHGAAMTGTITVQ
ncbi:MAG TPA: plastocyanin/azurin family copper-binding protein [Gemmatimonadaceae bacterium]|jgi:plastocyanin